jgi:PAS domain S-box-containing protein
MKPYEFQNPASGETIMLSLDGLERVLDSSPAAITVLTPEQHVVWASSAHNRLFGRDPGELVGRHCLDLVYPHDRNTLRNAHEHVLRSRQQGVTWESQAPCAGGGSRWVENTLSFLPAIGCVLYQHDVDARKAAELEHQRSSRELLFSYARLEEFAYGAAHDLQEPLRAISTCTNLLVRGSNNDSDAKQKAEFITSGVARMSALIGDMLAFAASGVQPTGSPVNLKAAVTQAAQDLEPEIARTGAKLSVGTLPTVLGNQAEFVRIFENLIGNALKYGGDRPIYIHISAEREGSKWVVAVKDTGCGIAVEHQAEIFEPFKRLRNSGAPGTGLGLALTKKIVERLGGAIWVQSDLGLGSTFLFSLPVDAEDTGIAKTMGA